MHIFTLMLISKLLKGKSKKHFKGFKGIIEIRHSLNGRIRFFVPKLKGNPEACASLEKHLIKAEVIREIKINHVSGSVLLIYKPGGADDATLTGVLVKLLGIEKEIEKDPTPVVGKELSGLLKSINTAIYEHSNGLLDLNNLITMSFMSMGIFSMIKSPRILPSGLSLLYWAYNNATRKP